MSSKDSSTERRFELVTNAQKRVDEFTNMLSIVSHLDALTRGELRPRPEYADLARLLEQLNHRRNAQRPGTPVNLRVSCIPADCSSFRHLFADVQNLTQLLNYILRFAWETTQKAEVSIDISLRPGALECVIANYGTYVSAADLDLLRSLEPWFSDASTPTMFEDPTLWLGLSLSNAIADAMGGQCPLDSDSERGLVWTLDLPTHAPSLLDKSAPDSAGDEGGNGKAELLTTTDSALDTDAPWSAKTLLVVDDSQASRLFTRALLESSGHRVI